jgi:DnaJ family protein C protein 3
MWWLKAVLVAFLSLDIKFRFVLGDANEVDKHLAEGKRLLQEGQLSETLYHYAAAVDGDPSNYMTYFKRAAVYLAMGQTKKALPDLTSCITLKPDFQPARLQRASTLLKVGKLDEAAQDYTELATGTTSVATEAQATLAAIPNIKSNVQAVESLIAKHDYRPAIELLGEAIEFSPWYVRLREMRALSYEAVGMLQSAISDIKMTSRLVNDNTEAFYRMSLLYYRMGEAEDSLKEIRECLKLDPDHKTCFPFYKKVKKLDKQLRRSVEMMQNEDYTGAISKLESILTTEELAEAIILRCKADLCHCHSKLQNLKEGKDWCGQVLEVEPESVDALCDRAELYISHQMYEEAVRDYQTAKNIEDHPRKVDEGLDRAQKLLKQSQKRDYYKILGVSKTASKQEINKVYRKLAQEWHPDAYDGEDKARAEKMFYDIAAAKEVLTDPELREKFDNGEDPLDHKAQSQNPWGHHGGFNFGQGQGFTFKFKWQ